MFIAYIDYMLSIVGVLLCLYSCSYSAHPDDQGVGGKHCLSMNAPYILGHVVDHEGNYYSFIESSVVLIDIRYTQRNSQVHGYR